MNKRKRPNYTFLLSVRTSEQVGAKLQEIAFRNGHDNISLEARKVIEKALGIKPLLKNGKQVA